MARHPQTARSTSMWTNGLRVRSTRRRSYAFLIIPSASWISALVVDTCPLYAKLSAMHRSRPPSNVLRSNAKMDRHRNRNPQNRAAKALTSLPPALRYGDDTPNPIQYRLAERRLFTIDEWSYLLDEIKKLLKPNGSFSLRMNRKYEYVGLVYGSPELMKLFEARGGSFEPSRAIRFAPLL